MTHLRTLTNNWYRKHFSIWGCDEHTKPLENPNTDCKKCKDLGTAHFYQMRKFLVILNAKRNKRILTHNHTYGLYSILRKKKVTGRAAADIVNLVLAFSDPIPGMQSSGASHLRGPLDHPRLWWHHEWLPLPSHAEILRKWDLPSTAIMIERRRATLLGNLIRHNAVPLHDIAQNNRASWWKQCSAVSARMKVSLEDAHKISFWKNSIKQRIS